MKSGITVGEKTEWKETWMDIRRKDILQPLIRKRMKKAIAAKCDAIEVDCLGAHRHAPKDIGVTKDDVLVFAKWVAEMAHQEGISIGLKNVATLAESLEPYFDFAVVESCARSPKLCAHYIPFTKHGKAVFTIHYGNVDGSFEKQKSMLVKEQKGMGFTCIFNTNQNLKQPCFSYNCDTGSTSNIRGSIPEQQAVKITTTIKKTTTVKTLPRKTSKTIKATSNRKTTTKTVPSKFTSSKTIPTKSISLKTTPSKSIPTKTIPTKTIPTKTISSKTIPTKSIPIPSVASTKQALPTTNPAKSVPAIPLTPAEPIGNVSSKQLTPAIPNTPEESNVSGTKTITPETPDTKSVTSDAQNTETETPNASDSTTKQPKQLVNANNNSTNSNSDQTKNIPSGGVNTVAFVAAGGFAAAATIGFLFIKRNNKSKYSDAGSNGSYYSGYNDNFGYNYSPARQF